MIVAAGSGERLGAERPKAFVVVAGLPMVEWSVRALRELAAVERIVVALPPGESAPEGTIGVAGGATRSASVRAALAAAGEGDPVIVHDAARPLAAPELFRRALMELEDGDWDGVIAASPVPDTIKRIDAGHTVLETLDRAALWSVQTPQAFHRLALERALNADDQVLARATDDAWLVERSGGRVGVLPAPSQNLKVTTRTDLQVADLLLRQRRRVAVVTEIIAAVNAGRMEDPLVHYHDDVVWDVSRLSFMPGENEVYRGHEGLRAYWRSWLSAWETVHFETEKLLPVGDHVVQFQRQRVRGRESGVELEPAPYAQVWTFRGDKVAAMRFFADPDEAMRFTQAN